MYKALLKLGYTESSYKRMVDQFLRTTVTTADRNVQEWFLKSTIFFLTVIQLIFGRSTFQSISFKDKRNDCHERKTKK